MMHEREKSDPFVVAKKSANEAAGAASERAERREGAVGNTSKAHTRRTRSRVSVTPGLERVRQRAKSERKERFSALLHHVDVDRLRTAYACLKRDAAPGVDGQSWRQYGQDLAANLEELHGRLHHGVYRAQPSRRKFIPKADGRERPLGVVSLEDKIVQRAVVEVLNAIYEEDFLGFSYGFRPGRSPHDALDALAVGIERKKVNWVLDADIRDFFGQLDQAWLRKFLRHRIADRRVLRLIDKWLAAGVIEDGQWTASDQGSPQGASVSPLLANVYLHYVLDLWADWWRRHRAHGDVIIVRWADDFIVGFEHEQDARRFWAELAERFAEFGLELHPDKTRLIEFGRFAAERRRKRGSGKPETFDFLGFTHICGKGRNGRFLLRRITIAKRMQAKLKAVKQELRRRRHQPIRAQGQWLRSVAQGHMAYYSVPGNTRAVGAFRHQLARHWWRALRRRSQRGRVCWERMRQIATQWLPQVRVIHPYPKVRFAAKT
jgi:RNA-directed DNA polymerase